MVSAGGNVPNTPKATNAVFFRHGEIILLLEPDPEAPAPPVPDTRPGDRVIARDLNPADLEELRTVLTGTPDPTARTEDPFHANPFGEGGTAQRIVPFNWEARKVRLVKRVYLSSWDARLAQADPDAAGGRAALRRAIADVGDKVARLNKEVENAQQAGTWVKVGPYRLVAAAPNWLAVPHQVW